MEYVTVCIDVPNGMDMNLEETNANNQMILDNAAVQKLSQQEVEALKAESLKGNLSNDVSDETSIANSGYSF